MEKSRFGDVGVVEEGVRPGWELERKRGGRGGRGQGPGRLNRRGNVEFSRYGSSL